VSAHRALIANGVFPWFRSTPSRYRSGSLTSRLKYVAGLVKDSGAGCATFGELGLAECATLARYLPWQYDRAQGTGRGLWQAGINSCWSDPDTWDQPESGLGDFVMPSAGQTPPRTLLLAQLKAKTGTDTFTLGAFHETLTNAAGLAYVKAMVGKVDARPGNILLGGDFKRTGDSDDLAYMRAHKLVVHERTAGTPMACFTRGDITVQGVDHISRPKAFDHEYLVVDFTINSPATPAGKKAA
jgi:hypothetical protein